MESLKTKTKNKEKMIPEKKNMPIKATGDLTNWQSKHRKSKKPKQTKLELLL
jgi:hypothetical protein